MEGLCRSHSVGRVRVMLAVLGVLLEVANMLDVGGVSRLDWQCFCLTILQERHVLRLQRPASFRGPRSSCAAHDETSAIPDDRSSSILGSLAMKLEVPCLMLARAARAGQ
jgi:hypothetical protein